MVRLWLSGPFFLILVFAWTPSCSSAVSHVGDGNSSSCYDDATTIHEFAPVNIDGKPVKLSKYLGKVLLVVNVASFCKFTSQYHGLSKLKNIEALHDKFEILAFPCNQFGYQEPGANKSEIMNCLQYARPGFGYTPNFEMFKKINVNGEDEIALFTHLKASCPPVKLDIGDKEDRFWSPFRNNDLTWNFNKFLIDKKGVPRKRYDSAIEPAAVLPDIRALITAIDDKRKSTDADTKSAAADDETVDATKRKAFYGFGGNKNGDGQLPEEREW